MSNFEHPFSEEDINEQVRRFSILLNIKLLIASVEENTPRFERSLSEIDEAIKEYDKGHSNNVTDVE